MPILLESFTEALTISFFAFTMMVVVDYLDVLTKGRLGQFVKGGRFRQRLGAAALAATPGCFGIFLNVSFYIRGLISFGALAGAMIASSGDEAFVMLAMFPKKALFLFFVLFVLGAFFSFVIDKVVRTLKIETCEACETAARHESGSCRASSFREIFRQLVNPSLVRFLILGLLATFLYGFISGRFGGEEGWERISLIAVASITLLIVLSVPEHYLKEHIWHHIFRRHLFKIFLWALISLVVVGAGSEKLDMETIAATHGLWILLAAVVIGIIPQSGPHLLFVVLFAKGLIPFSILLASSIVQDGHGMLPLLSHSVRDAALMKGFNVVIGLAIGLALFLLGF